MLAGVIESDDLNSAGKMQIGLIPDPLGPIRYDDFLFRTTPASGPGFPIDALSKLFSSLDSACVGG